MNLAKLFLVKKTQRGGDGGVGFSSPVAHRKVLKRSVRSPLSENVKNLWNFLKKGQTHLNLLASALRPGLKCHHPERAEGHLTPRFSSAGLPGTLEGKDFLFFIPQVGCSKTIC